MKATVAKTIEMKANGYEYERSKNYFFIAYNVHCRKEEDGMMKKLYKMLILCAYILMPLQLHANDRVRTYNIRITGEDWGPTISEIILPFDENLKTSSPDDFQIYMKKCFFDKGENALSCDEQTITPLNKYRSNESGKKEEGNFYALTLPKHPTLDIASPFGYDTEMYVNIWADIRIVVTNKKTNQVWDIKGSEYRIKADEFKKGTFSYMDEVVKEVKLAYASYEPMQQQDRQPLLVWLHGSGEGGVDPDIVLFGNKATNLASNAIQSYFKSANILAPQAETFWPDQGDGTETKDGTSRYSRALMALIQAYVNEHSNIDPDRIYIGGASNGGYMSLRLVIDHPQYFAAAFPICAAFPDEFISSEDIKKIRDMPLWFIHSTLDESVPADKTTLSTFKRLEKEGAKNIVYTMYDKIYDRSKTYFEEDGVTPYNYNAHASWIPALNNDPKTNINGTSVNVAGKDVTLFEWLSLQRKQSSRNELVPPVQQTTTIMKILGVLIVLAGGFFLVKKVAKKS